MSGGSFDYAYSRLDDLDDMPATLESMAAHCRGWAADERGRGAPLALEQRALVLVRALLLERAAARLRRANAEVRALRDVMHDVEWVASGDYSIDQLVSPLPTVDE